MASNSWTWQTAFVNDTHLSQDLVLSTVACADPDRWQEADMVPVKCMD